MTEKGDINSYNAMGDQPPPYNYQNSGYPPPNQNMTQGSYPPNQYPPNQYPPPQNIYPNQYAPVPGATPVQGQVYHQQAGIPIAGQTYPPGSVVIVQAPQSNIPDYLVFNIVATIFCCWIIGIFAIVKSLNVQSFNRQGRSEEARQASQSARRLGYWTVGAGASLIALCILISIVIPIIAASTYY